MTDTQPSRRTRLVAASLLWTPWLVSTLPLFVLLYEFRCGELGECGAEWSYYARFYSHFFLYPITFGLISTFFLRHPWARVVHHVCSIKPGLMGFIVISVVAVVSFISYQEFSRATPAPWDIAPEFMKNRDEGKRVLELIGKRCDPVSEPHALTNLDNEDKREFQDHLNGLWDGRGEHRSYTSHFYRTGFIGMTFLFAFLGATVAITAIWNLKNKEDSENRRATSLVMFALVFASFWVVMRFTFIMEKMTIYSEDPLRTHNWAIFLVFFSFYVWIFITSWHRSGIYDKVLNLLPIIASIPISIILAMDGSHFVERTLLILVDVFGTGSSPETYITVILFLLVIFFPGFLRSLNGDGRPDDPARPGAT